MGVAKHSHVACALGSRSDIGRRPELRLSGPKGPDPQAEMAPGGGGGPRTDRAQRSRHGLSCERPYEPAMTARGDALPLPAPPGRSRSAP
jgi:hypothetical protein